MLKKYFLKTLRKKYNEKITRYNYSLIPDEFKYRDKINFICPKHGVFIQTPDVHFRTKIGCPKCSNHLNAIRHRSNTEEFIYKAILIHGDKYDYSKVAYINNHTKVIIICKIHGEFEQTPNDHLAGKGCSKCGLIKNSLSKNISFKDFVIRSNKVHNNKYTYKDDYVNTKFKTSIICPIHGLFRQLAKDHLRGRGCFKCKESSGERYVSQTLDKYNIKYIREYKIELHSYKYDFYLPEYNIYIEYHGKQHYERIKHFGSKDKFDKTQRRDKIKIELIKRSSGLLITIKYTFKTQIQIEDELLRLFSIIHPQFLHNKELIKQVVIDFNIYLIQDGKIHKRN